MPKIKPISQILTANYFIPAYQRGYRWENKQVRELLDDINSFKPNNNNNNWYCLQPLVVMDLSDNQKIDYKMPINEPCFEVIDGQQRLTTICLILKVLTKNKECISIKYQSRPNSQKFLNDIDIDINNSNNLDETNPDYYCMTSAILEINNWKNNNCNTLNAQNLFLDKLKQYTKVIWEPIQQNNNPITAFKRLNIGKVPLNGVDLVKSLFLQETNFNNQNEKLALATEWYNIETQLMDNDFFYFICPNPDNFNYSERFAILLDEIMKDGFNQLTNVQKEEIGEDDYCIFRYYQYKIVQDGYKKAWQIILDKFNLLSVWRDNQDWYHYIGFLRNCNNPEPLRNLWALWNPNNQQNIFSNSLKDLILRKLNTIIYNTQEQKFNLEYGTSSQRKKIRDLLLLFNIISHKNELNNPFLFHKFRVYKYDLEHIDSFTEQRILDIDHQKEWCGFVLNDYQNVFNQNSNPNLWQRLNNFIQGYPAQFDLLRNEALSEINGTPNVNYNPHRVGNLALLPAPINRAYKNAPFLTKRRVIQNNPQNHFVPIGTLNVFLKNFNWANNIQVWDHADNDINSYEELIALTILNDNINIPRQ
ncbi:MAG: DUF262 domain-containing protein [Bacteroidales bacterium]